MFNPFKRYHRIRKFKKNYPWYKRLRDNIIFFFLGIIVSPRENMLTKVDIIDAKRVLRRGDIILIGQLKLLWSLVIQQPLTHSALYLGGFKAIHSNADGVNKITLQHLFSEYDTMAILRLPRSVKHRKGVIRRAIRFAKSHLGKPYNWDFEPGTEGLFCTQLINESFYAAGFKTGLKSLKSSDSLAVKIAEKMSNSINALQPVDFLNGKFDMVFHSHNLLSDGKSVEYIEKEAS